MEFVEEGRSNIIKYKDNNDPHLKLMISEIEKIINTSSYLFFKEVTFVYTIKAFQIDNFYFSFYLEEQSIALSQETAESSKIPKSESNITKEDMIIELNKILNGDL